MRGDLTVQIVDNRGSAGADKTFRHVTRYASNLRFRKTAPGGFTSASITINVPRSMFPDLGPADKVYVYDARTGRTIFEGYAENPTATDGPGGQSFELSILGTTILAGDQSERLVYIDKSVENWSKDANNPQTPSGVAESGPLPDGTQIPGSPGVFVQFQPGQPIGTGAQTGVSYDGFTGASTTAGGLVCVADAGKTDAGYDMEWFIPGGGIFHDVSMSVAGFFLDAYAGEPGFATGQSRPKFRLRRIGGATNIADDSTWAYMANVHALGHLMDRHGTLRDMVTVSHGSLVGGIAVAYVLAHEVAEDLVGRLLHLCDPVASTFETATWQIDQLAYLDGATAARVLDDLALYEPDHLWELLHSTSRGVVFRYRKWPTEARYEVSVKDGYSAPGGEADLCNRIAVYWTDERGNKRTTPVTSTVPELGSRTKDAESVTLPDGQGSAANAQRLGEQVLATKAKPPKAAKVTIRRPILDRQTGNTVMPWELEPGCLVTVRETGDTLRCTEMEYEDEPCAATLTLGEPTMTVEQRVATLARRR